MNRKDNIVLIGFMGCGKTTFGKWLAAHTGKNFCDTDDYIEQKQKKRIKDIFASEGEEYFRALETAAARELCDSCENTVISVGGGLPLRKENRRLLKQLGLVVYLQTTPEELVRRLRQDTTRPLLAGGDIEERIHTLMEVREAIYNEAAQLVVDTDGKKFEEMYHQIEMVQEEQMKKLLIINGPNINFVGIREKGIYGTQNYEALVKMIEEKAAELHVSVEVFQSNHEGAVIDKIQQAYYDEVDGIVINPGAFTHYSYAVRDALASVEAIPKIEVHISNVHQREAFRHTSVTVPVCNGQIVGLGLKGYLYAMEAVLDCGR